jgi:hypothetical protein
MADHHPGKGAEGGSTTIEAVAPPPEIEEQLLLEIVPVHARDGAGPLEPTRLGPDMPEKGGVDRATPVTVIHDVALPSRTGSGARSMVTGENSPDQRLVRRDRWWRRARTSANQAFVAAKKSLCRPRTSGEFSSDGQGPLV